MIKLIASDLDGTLLSPGQRYLNPELFDLILQLKEKGIHFVAASGRQLASMQTLFQPILNEISYIAENGAICIHKNELIFSTEIDRNLVMRIVDAVKQYPGCKILLSCMDTCYIESGDDQFLHDLIHIYHNDTTVVDDFTSIQKPFIKVAVFCPGKPLEAADDFRKLFGEEIKVVTSGNDWVDFIPLHSNKGITLKHLLEQLELDPADVITFGDQQNDIEMLQLAGKSYVVSSALPDVATYADDVTDSVVETLKELYNHLKNSEA